LGIPLPPEGENEENEEEAVKDRSGRLQSATPTGIELITNRASKNRIGKYVPLFLASPRARRRALCRCINAVVRARLRGTEEEVELEVLDGAVEGELETRGDGGGTNNELNNAGWASSPPWLLFTSRTVRELDLECPPDDGG
jgi:hypothetical protein